MKKIRVTYFALGAFLSVVSCTKEMAEPDGYKLADGTIYFRTSLSDVDCSRAQDMTLDRLESFQVTCFNTADRKIDPAGYLSPYFENSTFIRKSNSSSGTTYVSLSANGHMDWPANDGPLKFFAFSPSLSVMADGNSALADADRSAYFNLINTSTSANSTVWINYRLGNVRINPDISHQFDFVTAVASGDRSKNFSSGVELAFRHQFCQVELKAWGTGANYNFAIAGVRLGNPVVEGMYVFPDDFTSADEGGRWEMVYPVAKDKVEYLYRSAEAAAAEGTRATGDMVFRINSLEHNTLESAGSIMGNGGFAMVIPTVNTRWEGAADPKTATTPYSTDKMYFSVLTRVTNAATGALVYPYPGNPDGMTVVSYAVDRSGNIVDRLYAGPAMGTYYTDPALQHPYAAVDGIEIMDFGWAAVPVDADWSAGKKYIYTLNYSDGIGIHDPSDPEPGKPILGATSIAWGVSVGGWDYAKKDENYTPDLIVP